MAVAVVAAAKMLGNPYRPIVAGVFPGFARAFCWMDGHEDPSNLGGHSEVVVA